MRAIILAAGEGRRVRPLTHTRPKVMLPVGNRPILEHVLIALHRAEVHDVTIVVGYKGEVVQRHFQDGGGFGLRIDYVHQATRAGTADALARALAAHPDDPGYLIVPGDNFLARRVLLNFLTAAGDSDALLFTESREPTQYGVVEVVDDHVVGLEENPRVPKSNLISTGILKIGAKAAAGLKKFAKDAQGLPKFIDHLARGKPRLRAVRVDGAWFDVDRPENLLQANDLFLAGEKGEILGQVEPGASLVGEVRVGKGSRIRSGTYIVGPATIGEGCEIGPHAVIYGPTAIGDNVTVGPFTELLESVIISDARIASGCTLHHVVLDRGVVLAPGVQMDRAHVMPGAEFGAVVGDGTLFGNGVIVQPGSIVGTNVRVAPRKTVGAVPDNARVV